MLAMRRLLACSLFLMLFVMLGSEAKALPDQRVAQFDGQLASGEKTAHHFLVDQCAKLEIIEDIARLFQEDYSSLKMTILDPTGRSIDYHAPPDDPAIEVREQNAGKMGTERFLVFHNPPPGRWSIALENMSQQSEQSTQYFIRIDAKDAAYELRLPNAGGWVKPGDEVLLEVQLTLDKKQLLGATVTATVSPHFLLTNIGKSELPLHDDGSDGDRRAEDGVYTAAITPEKPGQIHIAVTATDGEHFERVGSMVFDVSRQGAKVVRVLKEEAIDTDGDGKYESLDIVTEVEVSDAEGSYSLEGFLGVPETSPDKPIPPEELTDINAVQSVMPIFNVPIPRGLGTHQVNLSFPASFIRDMKSDGPYRVGFEVYDNATRRSGFGRLEEPYETQPYRWQDFE